MIVPFSKKIIIPHHGVENNFGGKKVQSYSDTLYVVPKTQQYITPYVEHRFCHMLPPHTLQYDAC